MRRNKLTSSPETPIKKAVSNVREKGDILDASSSLRETSVANAKSLFQIPAVGFAAYGNDFTDSFEGAVRNTALNYLPLGAGFFGVALGASALHLARERKHVRERAAAQEEIRLFTGEPIDIIRINKKNGTLFAKWDVEPTIPATSLAFRLQRLTNFIEQNDIAALIMPLETIPEPVRKSSDNLGITTDNSTVIAKYHTTRTRMVDEESAGKAVVLTPKRAAQLVQEITNLGIKPLEDIINYIDNPAIQRVFKKAHANPKLLPKLTAMLRSELAISLNNSDGGPARTSTHGIESRTDRRYEVTKDNSIHAVDTKTGADTTTISVLPASLLRQLNCKTPDELITSVTNSLEHKKQVSTARVIAAAMLLSESIGPASSTKRNQHRKPVLSANQKGTLFTRAKDAPWASLFKSSEVPGAHYERPSRKSRIASGVGISLVHVGAVAFASGYMGDMITDTVAEKAAAQYNTSLGLPPSMEIDTNNPNFVAFYNDNASSSEKKWLNAHNFVASVQDRSYATLLRGVSPLFSPDTPALQRVEISETADSGGLIFSGESMNAAGGTGDISRTGDVRLDGRNPTFFHVTPLSGASPQGYWHAATYDKIHLSPTPSSSSPFTDAALDFAVQNTDSSPQQLYMTAEEAKIDQPDFEVIKPLTKTQNNNGEWVPVLNGYFIRGAEIIDYNNPAHSLSPSFGYSQTGNNYRFYKPDPQTLNEFESPVLRYWIKKSLFGSNHYSKPMAYPSGSGVSVDRAAIAASIRTELGVPSNANDQTVVDAIRNNLYAPNPYSYSGVPKISVGKPNARNSPEQQQEIVLGIAKPAARLAIKNCNLALLTELLGTQSKINGVPINGAGGFLNNGDNYLTAAESHAWSVTRKGDIIDATPGKLAPGVTMDSAPEANTVGGNRPLSSPAPNGDIPIAPIGLGLASLIAAGGAVKTRERLAAPLVIRNPATYSAVSAVNDTLYSPNDDPSDPKRTARTEAKQHVSFERGDTGGKMYLSGMESPKQVRKIAKQKNIKIPLKERLAYQALYRNRKLIQKHLDKPAKDKRSSTARAFMPLLKNMNTPALPQPLRKRRADKLLFNPELSNAVHTINDILYSPTTGLLGGSQPITKDEMQFSLDTLPTPRALKKAAALKGQKYNQIPRSTRRTIRKLYRNRQGVREIMSEE